MIRLQSAIEAPFERPMCGWMKSDLNLTLVTRRAAFVSIGDQPTFTN